jgi:biopolymer transport protein ExbD
MAYKRRSTSILNLTPLIDIVFLLLVFFMLTAHFIEEKALDIKLPTAESATKSEDTKVVEVIVGPQGQVLVDGHPVELANLEETLRGALHAPGKEVVQLRGDQDSRLGLTVKVIDAARKAGAESLDILTEKQ